ncbi:MAG: SDR family oxidoreductase [Chloroflexi bacterium]|nr:SDR family oxidoreductase [Chloroflexota bacterium]
MVRYIVRRVLEIIPLILLVSLICFALMQSTPGGPMAMLSNNPMVTPEDVARAVAWLCGDDAEMVRGHVLLVDGGEMLGYR